MQPIKKRIYASALILAATLLFNLFAYFTIESNTRKSSTLEDAMLVTSKVQGETQEVTQAILVLTIHQSFSPEVFSRHKDELAADLKNYNEDYLSLSQLIGARSILENERTSALKDIFSQVTTNYNSVIQKANQVLASPQKFANDYGFASEIRKNEFALRKEFPRLAQSLQDIDNVVESKIGTANTAIVTSLLIALLLIALLLISPVIKSNVQGYQQLQQSLNEAKMSETLLRTVLNSSPDFIFILDRDQKYKMVNKTLSDAMGVKPEEFLGKDDLELGLSSDMILGNLSKGFKGLWNDNKEVLESGKVKFIPEETLYLNGKTRVVAMTKAPLKNAEGEIWGLLGFANDITETTEAQKTIRQSEKKYRYLFDINPMPMWIYDPETFQFLEANEKTVEQYGYTKDELLQMTVLEIRTPKERSRLEELVKGVHPEDRHLQLSGKWINMKKNGEEIFVDIISHAIEFNGKRAVLVLANDITKEVKLQKQLVEEKINRQNVIAKATIDVQEKERDYIGKELHDNVNQILTSAKLYLETATNGNTEKHRVMGIDLIGSAIREIRKLSKAFVPPSLNGSGLIISINELLSNIQEASSIETKFDTNISDEHKIDKGLKLTIFRIVQEQTTNILKYAEASEIHIELLECKNHLYLVISDNGKGFDVTQHRKGVGITNMMNRAEIYQGNLSIESEPGNGCTLSVDFKFI